MCPLTRLWSGKETSRGAENVHRNSPDHRHDGSRNYGWYFAYGSIALLAGGLHMGSHAVALSVNAFAYVYARRQAFSERFSFGTGKVNTLGVYRCDSVGLFCLADGLGKLPATVKPDKHCI